MTVQEPAPPGLPWVTPRQRRLAKWLYDRVWVRNRHSRERPRPDGSETHKVATTLGDVEVHVRRGTGKGTIVLVHPDRRYGGHWFVKTGWVDALHGLGKSVVWFDQPRYGTGLGGSPYLAENVLAVANFARHLDGPVDVVGLSLGAFATAIAAPHMPWVRRIVLESPYRSFAAWYKGQPSSAGKLAALSLVHLVPQVEHLDTQRALAEAPQEFLVAASAADTVTPIALSEDAIGTRPATWIRVAGREHLDLWSDAGYRKAVLEFLW